MKAPRPPGRPLSFDPASALAQAVTLFWQRGYADASIQEITDAMGINRPSLYATFGDKEALFLKVVDAYRMQVEAQLSALFGQGGSLEQTLRALFDQAISVYAQPNSAPRGCLLASAATAQAPQSAPQRDAVRSALLSIEAVIRRGLAHRLEQEGRADPERIDAMTLLASSFCYALSVRARLGVGEQQLRGDVAPMVRSVLAVGGR
ncbi:MAG: TetR/AcrR family transcriptional regulator [Burkholderiaceae bacterium]|nr:TetR/AcrR family transcriptional regulator [Burkholderiaceae bacterium]